MAEATTQAERKVLDMMEQPDDSPSRGWKPTETQDARIKRVYQNFTVMTNLQNRSWTEFNDRTLAEYIEDCEKRLNAYVLPREAQGKEEWEANFATRVYANKTKALLAAVARDMPDFHFAAVNDDNESNHRVAEIGKNLVRHSYNQGRPQEEAFFLGWSAAVRGTVLSYEGFERQNFVKKRIKSYDIMTGDVEEEMIEESSKGEPVSFEVGLMDLLIWDWYQPDIQKQPRIIWKRYYRTREEAAADWGHLPNWEHVRDIKSIGTMEGGEAFYHEMWEEQMEHEEGYLVLREMDNLRDQYTVICNGVELYHAPMLWTAITRQHHGKKMYPFAKGIYEPFANQMFFYGNSLVNTIMGEGDVLNTLMNSSMNKEYRSLVPPFLVGNVNKDLLDLEDDVVMGDTKIHVEDVSQVEQLKMQGVTASDIQMINLVSAGIDLSTQDASQQGSAQRYVTARAALAADESAKRLRGVFFMFMESLWTQKIRLRLPNIMMAYTKPRLQKQLGEDGTEQIFERAQEFTLRGVKLSDGSVGDLSVEFMDREELRGNRFDLENRVDQEEEENKLQGRNFEKMLLPFDYLDNLSYEIEVIPESLWQASKATDMALHMEKIAVLARFFPEFFAQNKAALTEDTLKNFGDDVSKYEDAATLSFEQEQALQLAGNQVGQGGGQESPTGAASAAEQIGNSQAIPDQ